MWYMNPITVPAPNTPSPTGPSVPTTGGSTTMENNGNQWAAIIASANQAALSWYQATRVPPATGQTVGVSATIGPGMASAQVSSSVLMMGAVLLIVVVLVIKA